ncbi:MAG: transketolase [Deltaproteobacteria bacterium]|nr:transketolase [Deltaproteobacteria bacterium]
MKIDLRGIDKLATTLRVLSAEVVEKAASGHPGMPMGSADMAAVLWSYYLRFNPEQPDWLGRDRFVLSAGHGSALLYSLLHLFGFALPMSQLEAFRQWGSVTPGHPEFGLTPGVDTSTGPLGQGFANGVGMALSAKLLAQRYGCQLFERRVFGIVSDGDLMEGVSFEAASLAGHLGLGNIVYLYDDNHISIGGSTALTFTEDVPKRFEAQGWHVQSVDGHDPAALASALDAAISESARPSLICARTTIGKGSPNKGGSADVHGAPLGAAELALTRAALGWTEAPFSVPTEVSEFCRQRVAEKVQLYQQWQAEYATWSKESPQQALALGQQLKRELPSALKQDLLAALSEAKPDATRNISGKALQVLAKHVPALIGGSADLEPSNKTLIKGATDVQAEDFGGRNIRFGVREHAMGAIANGLAYTRAWIPYTATFLVFADYMRPPLRLAALSHLQTLFIFTHDSFWVGEDGPTHQPIEQIWGLRTIPGLYVFRPADGVETAMCYFAALTIKDRPSALLFTRQNLPPLNRESGFNPDEILRGAYIVSGGEADDVVLVASGSEVSLALEAAAILSAEGQAVRVVSMPCLELYQEQGSDWQKALIPPQSKKVVIEAGSTVGWAGVVGSDALLIGRDQFGASAPAEKLAAEYGFTAGAVVQRIKVWLE